jgi:hypothetical protein
MISSIRSGILPQVARRSSSTCQCDDAVKQFVGRGQTVTWPRERTGQAGPSDRTFELSCCVKFSLNLLLLAANKKQYHDEQNVACTSPHTSISFSILLDLTAANASNIFSNNCLFESYWCLSLRTVNSVSFGLGRQPFRRRKMIVAPSSPG